MTTMTDIEAAAKTFANARSDLVDAATALRDDLEAVKRKHMKRLKRCVETTAAAQAVLTNAIDSAHELFQRPRSAVFHGIKVGLQKGKDTVTWSDSTLVANRITDQLPEQFDVLVETTYKPIASGLLQLDAETLTAIGVRRAPGKDSVLIKPVDGGVDKLVAALLKGSEEELEEAEEA